MAKTKQLVQFLGLAPFGDSNLKVSQSADPANIRPEEKEQAQDALLAAREAMLSGDYDIVILDEVNVATGWKLIDISQVVQLIKDKPENVELILTGRHADPRIIELADMVTNMAKVKHPYDKGILSRKGLDY